MLKNQGVGEEIFLGGISIYDVAVHGKMISNNGTAENLTRVATGT